LLFATGAGALARRSLGTAVIGGMLVSTALNLFVIPVFYVLFVRGKRNPDEPEQPAEPSFEEGDFSVSDVFEDEPSEPNGNGKKAGLINFIKEEDEKAVPTEEEPRIADKTDEEQRRRDPDDTKPDADIKD